MKKVLSVILALMMSASTWTAVYAAEGDGKKDVGPHEHQIMDMANMSCHYSECTICGELFNVGDHTFKDGKCTVCGHPEMINPFEDVKKDAWYHDEIVEAVYTGIINGKSETIFAPDDLLTYAEAVKLAACMSQVYIVIFALFDRHFIDNVLGGKRPFKAADIRHFLRTESIRK